MGRQAALGNVPSRSAASCLTHSSLSVFHTGLGSAKAPRQSHDEETKHPVEASCTSRDVVRDVRDGHTIGISRAFTGVEN